MVIISTSLIGLIVILTTAMNDARSAATTTKLDSDLSFALTRIEDDVKLASQFNGSPEPVFSDSYAPGGGWSYMGNGTDDRVLILTLPATLDRAGTPGRILTYTNDVSFNCDALLTYNPIHTYHAVFFVENQTLYKRFLIDSTTPLCNTQAQKQTCPADQFASWPTECEARDEIIATDVLEFSIDYSLSGDSAPVPNQYTNPSVIEDAKAATVTIRVGGNGPTSPQSEATLRLARIN